jgi:tetratricopeptide (TPR) repeat protein
MTSIDFPELSEAANNWNLDNLYDDLAVYKSSQISDFDKKSLCALLCRRNISYIALRLEWTIGSVRTELCRGLYQYLKALTGVERIVWNNVPDLLEVRYRKNKSLLLNQDINLTVELESEYKATSIVATIENEMLKRLGADVPESTDISLNVKVVIDYGDYKYQTNDYVAAIKSYKEAIVLDISCLGVLNKIASCYYQLKFYDDAQIMCNFVLAYPARNEVKVDSYNLLGVIYQELASQNYNDSYVQSAIYSFKQAMINSGGLNVIPAWNIVELLLAFSRNEPSYIPRAKLAFYDFKKIASQTNSNFQAYRESIIKEAVSLSDDGLDEWLLQQLNDLSEIFAIQ